MKIHLSLQSAAALLLICVTAQATAQESDPVTHFIQSMVQMHQDKSLCLDSPSSPTVRANLAKYLRMRGDQGSVTPKTLAMAMWSLYPCPFSPYRTELRYATERDVEGVWLFPESSQKLRFPLKASRQGPAGPLAVKCDAVGYYANGELRHALIAGRQACPFEAADDLEVARKNPQVSTWTMPRPGRLVVTRADVENHVEEWEVFSVATAFTANEVPFSPGDLVAYIRKENGNDVGVASQFRHLRRLPASR